MSQSIVLHVLLYLFFVHHIHLPHFFFFFFNDTATTEIYTLSLHDALPILRFVAGPSGVGPSPDSRVFFRVFAAEDRKSTRLNSSHLVISYAVFCLKKKKDRPSLTTLTCRSCLNCELALVVPCWRMTTSWTF